MKAKPHVTKAAVPIDSPAWKASSLKNDAVRLMALVYAGASIREHFEVDARTTDIVGTMTDAEREEVNHILENELANLAMEASLELARGLAEFTEQLAERDRGVMRVMAAAGGRA